MDISSVISKLVAERDRLQETIATAQHRLAEIETFLQLYEKLVDPGSTNALGRTQAHSAAPWNLSSAGKHYKLVPARAVFLRDHILNTTAQILSDGKRRSSRRLVLDLQSRGVRVGGSDPATNLSSYLSKAKDLFDSNIKLGGWGLKSITGAGSSGALSSSETHSADS